MILRIVFSAPKRLRQRAAGHVLSRRIRRFGRAEDGVMAPHILVFFFLMLVIGGIAVDVMRYETRRVAVQNTLDRATLAAASLKQDLDPQEVVRDYFLKAGLSDELRHVELNQGLNFRVVEARARAFSANYFMSILDVRTLEGVISSRAEQRINNVEIMLVLDISGSMQGSKLANLKIAAKEFVDTVKANDRENRISIGIVPYNAQVNAGPLLRNKFNFTHNNGNNSYTCVEFPAALYGQSGIPRSTAIPMMAAADVGSGTNTSGGYTSLTDGSNATVNLSATTSWCDPNARSYITLPTSNGATVKAAIDALVASGNTSIAIGMKWGTALLDPQARTVFDELITSRNMQSQMSGRPFDYDDPEAVKVLVLMTDGEHVASTRVADTFKTGPSPIYRSVGDGQLSIYFDRSNVTPRTTRFYWVPSSGTWQNNPYSSNAAGAVRLDWREVWTQARLTWIVRQLYVRSGQMTNNNALAMLRTNYASVNQMDSYLKTNCAVARANNVLVYAIAFQAPQSGQAVMRDCASDPQTTYYIEAPTPAKIRTAFAQIASNLSKLRLTQ